MTLTTTNPDCFFTYKLIANRDYEMNRDQQVVYTPDVFTPAFDNNAQVYTFSSHNRPVTYGGNINIDTLHEGSLVIDIIDNTTRSVIWRNHLKDRGQKPYLQQTAETIN